MNQFSAVILSKTPVKEQDIIINTLLENGNKMSFYIYGGRSSSKRKSSIIEYGHVLMVKLAEKRGFQSSDLKTLKEYSLKWSGTRIRENFKAFYLMSFYLEIIDSILIESEDLEQDENKELYSLLANAIFYLDQSSDQELDSFNHLFLFLTKLIFYQGIMPDLEQCLVSDLPLTQFESIEFNIGQGGFIGIQDQKLNEHHMRTLLIKSYQTPYKKVGGLHEADKISCQKLFEYFCHNMNVEKKKYKLYQMILA